MKKSRYFLKRTKFALATGIFPLFLGFLLLGLSFLLITFSLWADSLTIDKSLLPMANNVPTFYDIDGNKMDYQSDNYLNPDEIPANLKNAFVALEDKRFYDHNGYDTYRIAGAFAKNITKGGVVEGASTITQQLIKNTHLTFEKTMSRKVKEIALATKLEEIYTKDEILSMYLSVIYFGNGAYGVKSASKLYFDKDVKDLSLSECATLAGIIKGPTKYSPKNNLENAKNRRNIVLSVMHEEGYITYSQMVECSNEELNIADNKTANISTFFIKKAVDEVCKKLNITKYQLDNSGLEIYTTYSPKIQSILEENSNLNGNFSRNNVVNSSVVVDNKTGFVLAYHSSLGYEIARQGGSTLKPLTVYAPAIENDIVTLASPIDDGQMTIGDWTPKNYGDKYVGISNIRDAIKTSSNTVAVRVGSFVGEKTMHEFGKKFGLSLTENDKNLTLSLGATEKGQSPLQIARAYSTFSNNGKLQDTTFIRFIVENGKKIYAHHLNGQQIISKETAFLIADCLVDTAKTGTAKSLSPLPFKLASKTGTVSKNNGENTDCWNVSFTDKYTIVVWHGDVNETGGGHPTKHAYNLWNNIYKTSDKHDFVGGFEKPNSITKIGVDTYSTKRLNRVALSTDNTPSKYVKNEYFKKSNKVNFEKSLFECCSINFDISCKNEQKNIEISFFADENFTFKLSRKDVLGERIITIVDGKDKSVKIYDNPLFSGFKIEYTLTAYPKGKSHISGIKTKTVIV